MALAFLWCWQEVLEKDPLLACSGVPRAGLDQDGDMGRDRDRGMGRDRDRDTGRDRALFSPSGTAGFLHFCLGCQSGNPHVGGSVRGYSPGLKLLVTYFSVFAKTLIGATQKSPKRVPKCFL